MSSPNIDWAKQLVHAALVAAGAAGCLSCQFIQADPVHDAQVSALGGEDPNVPQGQYHRAGQPCNTCHGGSGPASTVFALAGTVFAATYAPAAPNVSADQQMPAVKQAFTGVDQAGVGIVDGIGNEIIVLTNCVGNFFISPDQLSNLTYPVRVAVSKGKAAVTMTSHISREGACANCHTRATSDSSPGQVFLTSSDTPTNCPVSPITPYPAQ